MPVIPVYNRQERYQAPGVSTAAPAPSRLPQAYENILQEFGTFSNNALNFLDTAAAKQPFERSGSQPNPASAGGLNASASAEDQADADLQLRQELLQSVRETAAQKGTVQTQDLDAFAAERFSPQQADTPAARDYLLLRRTAQEEALSAQKQQQWQRAAQEENLVRQVGSAASSANSLEAYLSHQLPAYEQRLKAGGASAETAQKVSAALRADTAASCVRRALAAGQEVQARDVFQKYASQMTPPQREECAQKMVLAAADSRARQVWERSLLETDASLDEREKWARRQLEQQEQGPLKQESLQVLSFLHGEAQAQQHARQAQVYRSVLEASNAEEALGALTRQRDLDAPQLARVRRAAQEAFSRPEAVSQAEKFNQLYFSSDEKAVSRAYEKGQLSARDYCVLQSVQHSRRSGRSDRETQLLCRGIEQWGKKKNFSEKDVQEIKYAVLSSAAETGEPLAAWKRVKELCDI